MGLLLVPYLSSCDQQEIQVYRIPKWKSSMPTRSISSATTMAEHPRWIIPKDWKEQPALGMRQGNFLILGKDDTHAEFSVTQFPGDAGGLLANINRWRGQLELDPISNTELASQVTHIRVASEIAILVDFVNKAPMHQSSSSKQRFRMLAAILPHGSSTYFFKMIGADTLVASQKSKFIQFLQSIRFSKSNAES